MAEREIDRLREIERETFIHNRWENCPPFTFTVDNITIFMVASVLIERA